MGPDRRLRYFIYARILISFLFLASALSLNNKGTDSVQGYFQSGIVRLMMFSFLFSLVSHRAFRHERYRFFVTYLQTIWDVLFVTLLLLFTGGILSPYSFLYLLSIMNAGVLLGRKEALYAASLCSILFGAMVDFQYFGLLESIGLSQADARQLGESHLVYTIILNFLSFGATALITGFLAERARESEAALQDNLINYEELARLNTKIVSNIETGLLTTNMQGNIRVFNPYAENLTGISQEEAYDQPIGDIFPELGRAFDTENDTVRGEFAYTTRDGLNMVFGYSVVPLENPHSGPTGVIVNFKDISAIRRMEDALKRADRLALVGELSARMAHEIRNPLAAMRGSVQMLSEQGSLGQSDARLLDIVLRESDRLNILISDFLAYARPSSPQKVPFNLHALVEDLRLLLMSDRRYAMVEIINHIPDDMILTADAGQIEQVLMNLFSNASDAMPDGGILDIGAHVSRSSYSASRSAPVIFLTIKDSGTGISSESAQHLFEPFWTSKASGTGLGLAIVYRIIDSHNGKINVDSSPDGGCCVTIELPL